MTRLSIIVPIYNVALYLRKCVDSLLTQDLDDYEIILVDDGSTDNSDAICDEYAAPSFVHSLTRSVVIKVIHQPNGGLSAARNTGIAAAKGDYLCFVDSDDYLEPNVLGKLIAQCEREQLDVLRFNYQNVRIKKERVNVAEDDKWEYEVFEPNKCPHLVDRRIDVVTGEVYLDERMGYACYAWQFIIRRDLIINQTKNVKCEKDSILFTPGLHFEDIDWMPRMMLNAHRVNSTPTIVYNYLFRQGSILRTQGEMDRIRKNTRDRILVISNLISLSKQYPSCQWLQCMYSEMVIDVLKVVAKVLYWERHTYIHKLLELDVFPLYVEKHNTTYALLCRLANISPMLVVRILRLKN